MVFGKIFRYYRHHPGKVKKIDKDFARNFPSKLEIFPKLKKKLYQH